jgi:flavin reductase (DIM6/NTAB) family NADH-FMN oxidoreductase RutF
MDENLSRSSRIVPTSVILLTVATKEKQDAMTASAMFVSEDLPLLVVSVAKHILTHDLIEEAGEFVLNVASSDQAKLARKLGATHGREVDKFKEFDISTEKASKVNAPMIKGSFAHLECKVVTSHSAGNYTIYVAEVVDYKVDDNLVPVAWHHNNYFTLGQRI